MNNLVTENERSNLPLVSVVMLNFNGEKIIENSVRTVLASDYPNFELKIVDNGSSDSSINIVQKSFGNDLRLTIIENGKNLGWPEGITVGVSHSRGKYIIILEPDTEVDRQWIDEMIKVLEADPSIGAAQFKLLFLDDKKRFDSAGGDLDYLGIESHTSAMAVGDIDRGQYDYIREIFYARGAAFAFRRDLFYQVGKMDYSYFLGGYDEIDLCWRIWLSGHRIVFVPRGVVYHIGGRLIARTHWPFWYFHLRKNHIATMLRNYNRKNVINYLPKYLIFTLLYGLYQISKGRPGILPATLRAISWNITNLRQNLQRRKLVQEQVRRVPDALILKHMSTPIIPWHMISSQLNKKIPGRVYYTRLEEDKYD